MAKEKLEEKVTLATEAEEITVQTVSDRLDKMVSVLNNIIAYCNTIEKWRTIQFQTGEENAKDSENLSKEAEQTEKS